MSAVSSSSSTTTTTTTTTTTRRNWGLDDDVVFLEGVKEFGRGRWADVMNYCHNKHKATHKTDSAKFQKHFNDMNDKGKSKYFKPYKRHKFVKPKSASDAEVKAAEEAHTTKENYNEGLHDKVVQLLTYLREKESLISSDHKETADKVKQVMLEKADERRKIKDERFQILQEQVEEEKEGRKRMIETASDVQAYLKEALENDKRMLGLFEMYFQNKRRKNVPKNDNDSDE